MGFDREPRVTAVLGPTNTGKTHYAIERMLAHRTGVIGLPLRLLAREVYDRIVALRGPSVVALVTGEERIVPPRASWWVCTVEAMPVDIGADFLAVDEIQLCADPDRGHIFSDRLLNARGLHETLFLGSDTMRGRIAALIPGARFLARERFSNLSYTGARKISRLPSRSAIVGFSVDDVYAIAELLRRQKGGAAVVMGALSPRTRNAQVALYQNGDVDHLVATDAIGMGLNLDITHVAFSGTVKYDGRRHRHLTPAELGQIAGRAGRYTTDGTFGVTGDASPLDPDVIEAIENHEFEPLRRLQWRNSNLDFNTAEALIASLETSSGQPDLQRARDADDLMTLRALTEMPDMAAHTRGRPAVRLLWEVASVPDFRKVSPAEHASLCARLHGFLRDGGGIPTDWLAKQIERIDRPDGDIDALSRRLAYIRTWTYVAQKGAWVDDADHWRDETRAVEDRLSDALHARLTQRFVDRRTSVLMRRLKQKEGLVATVTDNGEVTIDEQFIGRLEGFRFQLDPSASVDEARTLRAAGVAALAPLLSLRADKFYNSPDTEIDVTEQGGLMWGEHAVGKLVAGADVLSPQVQPFVDEDAGPEVAEKVRRRLGHWIDRRITALFQPLTALRDDETLTGMARGIAFRLVETLGVLPRSEVADDVKALDQDQRAGLRKHSVRFGQYTLFQPLMLKPAPTRLRLVLWALKEGFDVFPEAPPPGLVTVPAAQGVPHGYYSRAGYRLAGDRAIRIDMLERLADMIRNLDARGGFEATPDMLSITGLSLDQFAALMRGMGYAATEGTRPKRKPAARASAATAEMPTAALIASETAEIEEGAAALGETAVAAPEAGDVEAPLLAETTAGETPDNVPPGETPPAPEITPPVEPDVPPVGPDIDPPSDPDIPPVGPDEVPPGPDLPPSIPDNIPTELPGEQPVEVPIQDPVESPIDSPVEIPVDPPAEMAAPVESLDVESFYTFVRAPRHRPHGAPRGQGARGGRDAAAAEPGQPGEQQPRQARGPRNNKPRPQGDRPQGDRPQGERPQGERPKQDGPKGNRQRNERGQPGGDAPRKSAEGHHNGKGGGQKPARGPVEHTARPPRVEKPVDPDNPFAALMALKLRN